MIICNSSFIHIIMRGLCTFNWFIVAEFLASAALNDSKWALRSKLPITMLGRSRGKTGEPL